MTDANPDEKANRPPITDRHLPPAEPERDGPMGSITGVDRAALGLDAQPVEAPPSAEVDAAQTRVPGPAFGDWPATAEKPWQTSMATENDEAGIGSEPDAEGEI
jgi:hypothetical protein